MGKDEIGKQIAALPLKWDKDGKVRVLMVTTRESRRWIMPKGWRMDGEKPWTAAKIEALEEAGAIGDIGSEKIGRYSYDKRLDDGTFLPCRVTVYMMEVEKLKKRWKERKERKRRWFSLKAAAKKVDEPDLARLLKKLSKKPKRIKRFRKMIGSG